MSLLHAMVVTQPLKLSTAESKTIVTTPDPFCSLVLLETHDAHWAGIPIFGYQYSYLVLLVGEHSKFYKNPKYPMFNMPAGKGFYCTIGAGPGGSDKKFLVSGLDLGNDGKRKDVDYSILVHPPQGESNDEFIQELLDGYKHYAASYNNKVEYKGNPDGNHNFNSNSFTSGLLHAILYGKAPQSPPNTIGWDHPLPSGYFRIIDDDRDNRFRNN